MELLSKAERPVIYAGGGVVNSGPQASALLREFAQLSGFPVTNTLMGLGSYPGSDRQFLGMLGMHGTWEANHAMHDCDVMLNVGARFDDRITGRLDAFAPNSIKIHIDIDPSSINKNVRVDVPIIGDVTKVMQAILQAWKALPQAPERSRLDPWWQQIDQWRAKDCLRYNRSSRSSSRNTRWKCCATSSRAATTTSPPRSASTRWWAAQFLRFEEPNRWMTSGGLGTMGYGLPAALGVQVAHPDALVVDVAGESSILMNIQELGTAVQHRLPVKVFILNNEYMGMVRQWQELLHGGRYSESYADALPDFVKLAEAFGCLGLRATDPAELPDMVDRMLDSDLPVVFDVLVDKAENCFPMVPSGAAHNEMLLGSDRDELGSAVSDAGKALV